MASSSSTRSLFSLFFLSFSLTSTHSTNFDIVNNCPYTIWAAANPDGGRCLDPGQTWNLSINPETIIGHIWGRTGCNFNVSGHDDCQTSNCTGGLNCIDWGVPPNTLAKFAVNRFSNLDFYDISLLDSFNIPMDFYPLNNARWKASYTADINGQYPKELRVPSGCNHPCIVFKTTEYCYTGGLRSCAPTSYTSFVILKFLMFIVFLEMVLQPPSLAPLVPTTELCSVL